jgi:hypothetical protein
MNQGVAHPLDKLINDNSLIMLEAMVPFVDYRLKKLLVIYIKYREFTLLMNSLSDIKFMDGCGFNKNASSTDDMMEMLLSSISPNAAENISSAKKMMSMMQAMETLNTTSPDTGEQNTATFSDTNGQNTTAFSDTNDTANNIFDFQNRENTQTSLYDSIINIIENESEG